MDILGWKKLTVIIFGCLLLAGCSKSLPNTYQEGSDYQYMEKQSFYSFHQVGEKADYFAHDHYIYYMDKRKKRNFFRFVGRRIACMIKKLIWRRYRAVMHI